MDNINAKLLNAIDIMVSEKIKEMKFDKTFKSTVWEVNSDGTYKINYLGQQYDVYNALGNELKQGQSVWVKIPCGIMKNMHICGVNVGNLG